MTLEQAREKLAKYGQEHLLKYYGELSKEEKGALLKQIEETDMGILEACKHREELTKKGVITPLASMQLDEIEANRAGFTAVGMEAIRQGRVGAVLFWDSQKETTNVAFFDAEGDYQQCGTYAKTAAEPGFTYLGEGTVTFRLETEEGAIYSYTLTLSIDGGDVTFKAQDDLP